MLSQMLARWCGLLMLSAVNCRVVGAPDASTDSNDIRDNVAHIGALQGTV